MAWNIHELKGQRIALIHDNEVYVQWDHSAGIDLSRESWLWIDRSCRCQAGAYDTLQGKAREQEPIGLTDVSRSIPNSSYSRRKRRHGAWSLN